MKNKKKKLDSLFIELVKLQKEIIASEKKIVIILEGRDAAGKDGTIKTIMRHLSPREVRVVALDKPSDRQQREWYFQRYVAQLPASGEMVLFNRSWYNRAGVEKVMHFSAEKEYKLFFDEVKLFEEMLTISGFKVLKYYLDISKKEQEERLEDRKENPLKQWKVSPIDKDALKLYDDYSEARNIMLERTNFRYSPWTIVDANKKNKAHIAIIADILKRLEYKDRDEKLVSEDFSLVYPATPENIQNRTHS